MAGRVHTEETKLVIIGGSDRVRQSQLSIETLSDPGGFHALGLQYIYQLNGTLLALIRANIPPNDQNIVDQIRTQLNLLFDLLAVPPSPEDEVSCKAVEKLSALERGASALHFAIVNFKDVSFHSVVTPRHIAVDLLAALRNTLSRIDPSEASHLFGYVSTGPFVVEGLSDELRQLADSDKEDLVPNLLSLVPSLLSAIMEFHRQDSLPVIPSLEKLVASVNVAHGFGTDRMADSDVERLRYDIYRTSTAVKEYVSL